MATWPRNCSPAPAAGRLPITCAHSSCVQSADPTSTAHAIVADDGELARGLTGRWLAGVPAATRRFLTRTSVLMTLTGPLCDWLLDASDSDKRLAELAEQNLLVMPVHGVERSYRYQRLFGELSTSGAQRPASGSRGVPSWARRSLVRRPR